MAKIKIGIDARFYGPERKGLGRYTQEIVDRVVKLDQENEYVIFLAQDNFNKLQTDNPRIKKVLADVKWYSFAEQIRMPFLIAREKIDLMHFPHFNVPLLYRKSFVVTIHDLILTKFSTVRASTLNPLLYWFKNWTYRFVIKNAIKKAKKIITVSEFTKNDLLKNFKIETDKIVTIYLGTIQIPQEENSDLFKLLRIKKPFLLYVGNAYPHKNLERLIKNFSRIRKELPELQLVLVGQEDYFYKRLQEFAKEYDNDGSIIFTGFIEDKSLSIFYKEAIAYVFPSYYEGFGLPPLEAMAMGCPVVSSNSSCLPEILGEAVLYFNPENDMDLTDKIKKVILDNNIREIIITKGKERVKLYNWQVTAEQTLSIYQELLK